MSGNCEKKPTMCLAKMTRFAVGQERSMPAPRRQLVVVLSSIFQPIEKRTQAQLVTASTKNRVRRNLHCSHRLCFLPTQNNRKPGKNQQHTQCERTEIDCRHISLQRPKTVRIARSAFSEHVLHREQMQYRRSIVQVCDAFHKASRHNASRRTWAGSGRRLATDCVRKGKPCLRRCHGITHKQRRTHTELPIASLFPVPLPSADTENTRKMESKDQLCG